MPSSKTADLQREAQHDAQQVARKEQRADDRAQQGESPVQRAKRARARSQAGQQSAGEDPREEAPSRGKRTSDPAKPPRKSSRPKRSAANEAETGRVPSETKPRQPRTSTRPKRSSKNPSMPALPPGPAIPVIGPPLPYEPSVPCAACARGTDPLRAACISMTEEAVQYFCSRACRASYVRSEAEHHQKVARAPAVPAPVARENTRSFAVESVARRMAPAAPSTPVWPLLVTALLAGVAVASPVLHLPGVEPFVALALAALAAAFTSRATLTREQGSVFGWLAAPVGVAALALSGALARDLKGPLGSLHSQLALASAALGIVVIWLREHWLEREGALTHARRHEQQARLSPRVRLAPNAQGSEGEPAPLLERTIAQLAPGDELVLDAGAVPPVDGVVVSGIGTLMPYPGARLAVERSRGQLVLAGALLTEGTLRLRALAVSEQSALLRAFAEPGEPEERAGQVERVARGAAGMEHGLKLLIPLALVAAVAPQALALKLAAFGAGLVVLPAVSLARGLRATHRRASIAAAARGVSYREPTSLERAGALDTVVLRVEGPLVSRQYTLTEIVPLSDGHDARALLELALAAEAAHETHGIARAVREHAQAQGVQPAQLRRLLHTRGRGISGLTDGQGSLVFGSRAALLSAGVSVAVADREAQRAEQLGQRVVFLSLGGRARGLFVFTQTVQAEARVALQTMVDLGMEVELVSGDHRPTIEAIARTLDITQVKAELSAEQRAAEVRRLRDGEAKVVAIGHVPEDQALLAAANVSISLDASQPPGEHDLTFDITTASPDLRDAAAALSLARRARREVQQTLALCILGAGLSLLCALGAVSPLVVLVLAAGIDWLCLARPWGVEAEPSAPRRRSQK